jgi:hypothetical protein
MNVRFVVLCFMGAASISSAIAFSRTNPSVMQSVELLTSGVRTYEPFEVKLTFRESRCVQAQSPRYANVATSREPTGRMVITTYLSQLDGNASAGTCGTVQTVKFPGLPAGQHRLQFFVTSTQLVPYVAPVLRAATSPIESGDLELAVSSLPNEKQTPFASCESNSNVPSLRSMSLSNSFCTFGPAPIPAATPLRTLEVDVGDKAGVAFFATMFDGAPKAPFVPLYRIRYPTPYVGTLWTTSQVECLALRAAWGQVADTCDDLGQRVLALKDGVCPLGAKRVFRLFNAKEVEHRYTQDEALVPFLVGLGFVSEGAVFCAPSQ